MSRPSLPLRRVMTLAEVGADLPVLTRADAERARERILDRYHALKRSGIEHCRGLADFFDGQGNEALADEEGNPLPMAYWEAAFGVSRQRIHQWIMAGRAWRTMSTIVDAETTAKLTEAHLRVLADLPAAERLAALNEAKERARADHELRQSQREAGGRRASKAKPRLKIRHVRNVVDARLGRTACPQPRRARAGVPRVIDLLQEAWNVARNAGLDQDLTDGIAELLERVRQNDRGVDEESGACRN